MLVVGRCLSRDEHIMIIFDINFNAAPRREINVSSPPRGSDGGCGKFIGPRAAIAARLRD